jgi:raffinose/stachyose/melibiose transport system permease protein
MAMTMPRRRSLMGGYGSYLLPGLVAFGLVILLPFAMTIVISLTRWQGVGTPTWVGVDNYVHLFADATFWASFAHILALIVAMVIIPTLVGLVLAAILFDYIGRSFSRPWASFLRAGYYLPQILPIAVAGIVWGWILHPTYGALNAVLHATGLGALAQNWLGSSSTALLSVMGVMIWFQLGYPLVIFMAGLQRVDPEQYEAAELDGAGWYQRFRYITIDLIRPEIYVVVLTTTMAALKVFAQVFVLTGGGPGTSTIVPSYYSWQNFFQKSLVGYGSAIATVLTVIIIALAVAFLRIQSRNDAVWT